MKPVAPPTSRRWNHQAAVLRSSLIDLILARRGTLYAVLNFNRPTTAQAAQRTTGQLLARLDRHYLGPRWHHMGERRSDFIAIIENPSTNLHVNLVGNLPDAAASFPLEATQRVIGHYWQGLVAPGTVHVQTVYYLAGLADYVTKQLNGQDAMDRVFHAREFWP